MSDLTPAPADCPKPDPTLAPNGAADCCDLMLGGDPVSVDNPIPVDVTLVAPAIELGSVTIRDHTTADEAHVNAAHELSTTDADTHTALALIDGHVDGLEALETAGNATLVSIDGHVDGLETLQGTANASLAAIDAGIPAGLGAAVTAASMPVNIASDQVVPVSMAAPPVGGATAANQVTEIAGLASIDGHVDGLEALAGAGNASLASIDAKTPAAPATAGNQATANASLASIDAGIPAALGQVAMAASMPVVIASNQTPIPVALQSDVEGISTSALQVTGNASLASIDAGTPAGLGQTTMANSQPVVLASDQTDIKSDLDKVAGTATAVNAGNANNGTQRVVVATDQAALPVTNALGATAANQATGNASLAAIDAGIPAALGQATMAASMPVVLASDQTAIPVTNALGATAANQATANASLASIDAGTPAALGQATMANSQPVTLASDQSAVPTTNTDVTRTNRSDQHTTITSSTGETTIVTADATHFLDIYGLIVTNTSATGTKVSFRSATAGGVRFVLYIPPQDSRGYSYSPNGAIKQAAQNNNWTAQCGTSVADIDIEASYVLNT